MNLFLRAITWAVRAAAALGGAGIIMMALLVCTDVILRKLLNFSILISDEISGYLLVLLAFMALFSVNLAILNLLPIPVLDGGQLVFLLIEGVRGKPMPLELRVRFSQFGLVILLGIMVLALTNDLLRVFGG